MTVTIPIANANAISPQEFRSEFEILSIDPTVEGDLIRAAPLLASLAKDRDFLLHYFDEFINCSSACDYYIRDCVRNCQEFVIYKLAGGHYLRAIIWPPLSGDLFTNADQESFYYGLPHNHNFDFITTAYSGPGYLTDLFTINPPLSGWYPGMSITPPNISRERLLPGQVVFYNSTVDGHAQFPPESLSISLSVVAPGRPNVPQFVFDKDVKSIVSMYHLGVNSDIMAIAGAFDPDRYVPQLARIAQKHPDELTRFHALSAVGLCSSDKVKTAQLFQLGQESESEIIRSMSGLALSRLI